MSRPRLSHEEPLAVFPHLTHSEFEGAIRRLAQKSHQYGLSHSDCISMDVATHNAVTYLRITKPLLKGPSVGSDQSEAEYDDVEVEDDGDNEAFVPPVQRYVVYHYDVLFSPTYRVPVLYVSIADAQQRYPPTIETLRNHLIPPEYLPETDSVGILGGITIAEHPATNRPVFFIHPCQTAEVMEVVAGNDRLTADEYLMMWLGAFGKCIGLNAPLALARHMDR